MIAIIEKVINKIKKIFIKKNTVESTIAKYYKENQRELEKLKKNNLLQWINISLKNNSKDLFNLSNFKNYSIKLWKLSEEVSKPLLVMIMGEFKTGKSTFINAMLGEEVLKSDVTPATAVVSMISYGEEKKVIAHLKDGELREFSFEDLKKITAEGDETKKKLRSNIKYVEIFIPKEILKSITIIDTPGLNVDNKLHIQSTKEFMDKADIVFWVFAYGKAASRTEIASISELSKRLKPIAIINRIDEIDEEEESLEEVIEELEIRLKDYVYDVIGVSAYLAQKGIFYKDKQALDESRWNIFIDKFEQEILQNSQELKKQAILDKVHEYIEHIRKFIDESNSELINMEKKFTNNDKYKTDLLKELEVLKIFLNEANEIRKHRDLIIRANNLYEYWKSNIRSKLDKVTIPLNYILKSINVLKLLKNTEKIINNIKSYENIYDDTTEKLDKIQLRYKQLNEIKKQLEYEMEDYERQVNEYNTSGIFGGTPIFDWNGKAKSLENWKGDLSKRVSQLNFKYKQCDNDILNQFSRIARMNYEIYEYLPQIKSIFKYNITCMENEIKSFENNFYYEKQKYELLKSDSIKANNIILNLVDELSSLDDKTPR